MNNEHYEIVKQGEDAIAAWKKEHEGERLNLRRAYLRGANLSLADLSDADLSRANLSDADLSRITLCDCNLDGATITYRRQAVRIAFTIVSFEEDEMSECKLCPVCGCGSVVSYGGNDSGMWCCVGCEQIWSLLMEKEETDG